MATANCTQTIQRLTRQLDGQRDAMAAGLEALEALAEAGRQSGNVSAGALAFVTEKLGENLIAQLDAIQELQQLVN